MNKLQVRIGTSFIRATSAALKFMRFKMKFLLMICLMLPSLSQAAGTTFLCISDAPRGALAFHLDPAAGKSIGRQSNPYTQEWSDLLGTDADMWDKLSVGFVEKRSKDHFIFNASVYGLTNHPEVIAQTKSEIKNGVLKYFAGYQVYITMKCTKQKKALK